MPNHKIEFDYTFDEYEIGQETTLQIEVGFYQSANFDPDDTDSMKIDAVYQDGKDIYPELLKLSKSDVKLVSTYYSHVLNTVIPQYFFDYYLMNHGHAIHEQIDGSKRHN